MVAVAGFTSRYVSPLWNGTKNFARDYANIVVGVDQSTVFDNALSASFKEKGFVGFKGSVSDAWKASKKAVENKSLWKTITDSFSSMIPEFKNLKGLEVLGKQGKLWKGLGVIGKRMPLIGNILAVAMSLPVIYSAFTDKKNGGGLFAGLKEMGRTGIQIGAGTLGGLLGGVLGPVGAIAGMALGCWLADTLMPSFTDKAEEKEKLQQENMANESRMAEASSPSAGAMSAQPPKFGSLNPAMAGITGMTPIDPQKYAQLQAAYQNYSMNLNS